MANKEIKIKGETIYDGKIITVCKDLVELKDKSIAQREVVRHKGGCCAAALDCDNNILLVKQFRYPYNQELVELPAGKLDIDCEAPKDAAKRELLEETGHKAKVWYDLGILYPTPGYCDEKLYMYAAFSLKQCGGQALDDGEFVDFFKMPFEKAVKECISGEIKDAKTVAAILKLDYLLKAGKLEVGN